MQVDNAYNVRIFLFKIAYDCRREANIGHVVPVHYIDMKEADAPLIKLGCLFAKFGKRYIGERRRVDNHENPSRY
jgi:hypothetical protein